MSTDKVAVTQNHWSVDNNPLSLHAVKKSFGSNQQGPLSGGTADILPSERKKATFSVEKLMNFMDGGEEGSKRRRFILSATEKLDVSNKPNWTRAEYIQNNVSHFIKTHENYWDSFVPAAQDVSWMSEYSMLSGAMSLHMGVFISGLLGQASMEQVGEWLPRALTCKVVGCYAQTEIGHGSNVRGLQTTATYDHKTQQFILNTPSLLAVKWWPSALGKISTHAMLYAQLILDGKEMGVHVFLLQVRDENHRPLPGIEVGDMGPKLGDHANDTAFMRLTNVRIPRTAMYAKYQHIDENGQYVKEAKKTSDKLHYRTMLTTRAGMLRIASGMLARAVTIAARYSCVRMQGFIDTSASTSFRSNEQQIINYQIQRYRILKQLSFCYAVKITAKWMMDQMPLMGEGDEKQLVEIAAISSGLKALITYLTSEGIEDCRKCCGGNGYLLSSGVAMLQADYAFQPTAEGDWVILLLLTARNVVKTARSVQKGELKAEGAASYLNSLAGGKPPTTPTRFHNPSDFFDLKRLLELYSYRAALNAFDCVAEVDGKMGKGMTFDEAWNSSAMALVAASKAHIHVFLLSNFIDQVSKIEDKPCQAVMQRVCALYGCSYIQDDNWAGIFDRKEMSSLRTATTTLLNALRNDIIPLTDVFDIPDRVLCSTIGRYDGNVYEALYEAAKESRLNKSDPFLGYDDVLRKYLDLDLLKAGNSLSAL